MKTSQWAATTAAVITMCTLVSTRSRAASASPSIPVGSLTAVPTIVQTGTKPTLTWAISYPSVVKNFVTVTPPATITPKQNLIADVRILGQGVTVQDNSKLGYSFVRTVGQIKYNGSSSWTTVFDGVETDTKAQQQAILTTINVTSAKAIDFSGHYVYNGSNGTTYTSLSGTNVRCMVNGDTPPPYLPAYNAPALSSFLKPYLDASGKVNIGPMDAIIYMELTHTNTSDPGYDFQDLVLLITFRTS